MSHRHAFGPRGTAQCRCGIIPGQTTEENLRSQLALAIELAEEGWSYASDYFRNKWQYEDRIAALRSGQVQGEEPKT